MSDALRSRHPYNLNMLIAGCTNGPELYWLDMYASVNKIPFAAHGYAAFFCMSLMDRHYRADMSLEDAKELMLMCFRELKMRFIVNFPSYIVKVVDKSGIRIIDLAL